MLGRQEATGQWVVRDHADALGLGQREDRVLAVAVQQVVARLQAGEALDAEACRRDRCLGRLDRAEVARAAVQDLALAAQILEHVERLLDRRVGVHLMHLEQIDPVRLQTPQACLDAAADVQPPIAALVRRRAHWEMALRGQHDLVASARDDAPEDLLGQPVRLDVRRDRIGIRGIQERHARVKRAIDNARRLSLVGLTPERHRAQAGTRDTEPRSS